MSLIENYKSFNLLLSSTSSLEKVLLIKKFIKSLIKLFLLRGDFYPVVILDFKDGYNKFSPDDNGFVNKILRAEYVIALNDPVLGDIIVKLRPGSSDAYVFIQIFGDTREYNGVAKMVKEKNQSTNVKVIVDAGANVGFASIFFSKNFPNAKVIAIEPDHSNFLYAERNVNFNDLKNIILLERGLWYRNNKLKIENNFRGGLAWALTVVEDENGSVNAISLEELINEYNIEYIDILKMDIEGTEKYIFDNLIENNFLKKTKFISIEIHDEFDCRQKIYDTLTKYSFSYLESGEGIIGYNNLLVHN